MTPFTHSMKESNDPLFSASFFIWVYHFYGDRIEIWRNFFLTRKTVIYIDKIEMLMAENDPVFSLFGRCNLFLTFAGNVFMLFGIPKSTMERFAGQFAQTEDAGNTTSVRISNRSLLKKSILQTKWVWYLVINLIIWPILLIIGNYFIDTENIPTAVEFLMMRQPWIGALIVSLGIPTAFIWIWMFTGGFLNEFLKYYHYTANRRGDLLYFEHGFLIRRQVYLDTTRIAIVEFRQSAMMRVFGYGQLSIQAVGHNPLFFKSKLLMPFIHISKLPEAMSMLFPTVEYTSLPPCKCGLRYNFITWKWLIPLFCFLFSLLYSASYWILFGCSVLAVVISVILEYRQTGFWAIPDAPSHPLVILSRGGFRRTIAWIDARRIEMIAVSGSRRKLKKGYLNIRVHVFDKSGTYALVRNIDASVTKGLKGLDHIA